MNYYNEMSTLFIYFDNHHQVNQDCLKIFKIVYEHLFPSHHERPVDCTAQLQSNWSSRHLEVNLVTKQVHMTGEFQINTSTNSQSNQGFNLSSIRSITTDPVTINTTIL